MSFAHGHSLVKLEYKNYQYTNVKLSILTNLCSDVILGHGFLRMHQSVEIPFPGTKPPFSPTGVVGLDRL